MMSGNLLALCIATAILAAIPGPNVLLIVANSLRFGLREGSITVFGTTAGVAAQLLLVALGMVAVIEWAAGALAWVKWAGVLYLLYLGIRAWREPVAGPDMVVASRAVFWRAFAVAALNPKTLLFNAAFLPQFLEAEAHAGRFLQIAVVFLAVILAGDLCWAGFASQARRLLRRYGRIRNRVTGGFLVTAGVGLALSRRDL